MNYRDEVVVSLGLPAIGRLSEEVKRLAKRSLTFVRTDGISFVLLFRGLSALRPCPAEKAGQEHNAQQQ